MRQKDAGTTKDLESRLESLFGPIAPSVLIYRDGDKPPAPRHLPRDTAGLQPVAWQHEGVLISPGRPNASPRRWTRGPNRGRELRLRVRMSALVRGMGNHAQTWMRVDLEGGGSGFFDHMAARPVTTAE